MTEKGADSLSSRACRLEDIQSVLGLWRQADATPGVTDTAEDLRRAIADSPAHVLVAEVEGRLVGSIIGTFDGWRGNIYRLDGSLLMIGDMLKDKDLRAELEQTLGRRRAKLKSRKSQETKPKKAHRSKS